MFNFQKRGAPWGPMGPPSCVTNSACITSEVGSSIRSSSSSPQKSDPSGCLKMGTLKWSIEKWGTCLGFFFHEHDDHPMDLGVHYVQTKPHIIWKKLTQWCRCCGYPATGIASRLGPLFFWVGNEYRRSHRCSHPYSSVSIWRYLKLSRAKYPLAN